MAKNMLVIDDEGLVTKSLGKLLTKEGYNAVIASGAAEAMEKLKASNFDLIISDIMMPQIDGIEAIRKLRQIQKDAGRQPIPEIIITGYADQEKYKEALKLGVSDYIFKPFDTQQFLEAIKRKLNVT
ncbi:MAG: response regulator [Candidatus Pacebacteria bacterium]|nr:response regulator [Candidatus Paceibacterota bacterium]